MAQMGGHPSPAYIPTTSPQQDALPTGLTHHSAFSFTLRPPRWTTVSRAGRSGWAGVLHTFPHRSAVCPSLISPVFHQQGPLLHLTRPSQNPQDYKGTGRYGKPGQEGGRPHPHRGQLMLHRLTLYPPRVSVGRTRSWYWAWATSTTPTISV